MNTTPRSTPIAPRCVFVTGPGAGVATRWLRERIAELAPARCAVLVVHEAQSHGPGAMEFESAAAVRWLMMPCLCCPGLADLPRVARRLADDSDAEWLFIVVPVLAAGPLVAEFDRVLRWPREVVVCVSGEWSRARRARTLSEFQARLLALADHVVEPEPAPAVAAGDVATLSLP